MPNQRTTAGSVAMTSIQRHTWEASGKGVAQDGVEREGQELARDDHEFVLRDDPPALGRR